MKIKVNVFKTNKKTKAVFLAQKVVFTAEDIETLALSEVLDDADLENYEFEANIDTIEIN